MALMTEEEFQAVRSQVIRLCRQSIQIGSPDYDLMSALSELSNKYIVETQLDHAMEYPRQEIDYFVRKNQLAANEKARLHGTPIVM